MLVIILLGVILAIVCYMFYVIRGEFFRVSERQSNTLMHIARMNRGLLSSLGEMLGPPTIMDSVETEHDHAQKAPEETDEAEGEEASQSAPPVIEIVGVAAPKHQPLPVIEEVPRTSDA